MRGLLFLLFVTCIVAVAHSFTVTSGRNNMRSSLTMSGAKKVLLIGGTRFSGLYLWKELISRGHDVTLFNRGKTALKKLPKESAEDFEKRKSATRFINGNRQDAADLKSKLSSEKFDVVYDMNGREASDTAPLADIFNGKVDHFIYMSSAGSVKNSHIKVPSLRHTVC